MNVQVLLHVSLIEGIGPVTVQQFMHVCQAQHISDVYQLTVGDVCSLGFTQRMAQLLVDGLASTVLLDQELALLARHDIQLITLLSEDYPALLRHITAPPPVLYVRGKLIPAITSSQNQCLAIVGSRQGTGYAKNAIDTLMPELAAQGWCIVSGGARGVDSMAHQAALAHQTPTVAVLGAGLLEPYPASNKQLFDRIVYEGGAVISAFPLHFLPNKGNFPARNRIIVGLSRGVVVVQAAERSGALISAYYALEQGREVFAVPGPFSDPLSVGCHALLRQGATVVCSATDIFREFGVAIEPVQRGHSIVRESAPNNSNTSVLTFEDRVLNACHIPRSIDELVHELQATPDVLYACVLSLQLSGRLTQDFAGLLLRAG